MNGNEEGSDSAESAALRARHLPRAGAAIPALAVFVTGCGGSNAPSVTNLGTIAGTAGQGSPASAGATSSGSIAPGADLTSAALTYARCGRSSGVPNFPDPSANGDFRLARGTDPSSPAFRAAQAKCQKLLPGGGPAVPASTTHPSPEAMAGLLKVAHAPARRLRLSRPHHDTPVQVQLPHRRGERSRRSDRCLPGHARHAVAVVPARGVRVRVPAHQPRMIAASTALAALIVPPGRRSQRSARW
jgi:hypothetical protein